MNSSRTNVDTANGNGQHAPDDIPARRWETAIELVDACPELRPYIVTGVCRKGEIGSFNSGSKARKSWLMMQLCACLATGGLWLDRFQCIQTNVMVIDAELHRETWADRIKQMADGMGLNLYDFGSRVCVHCIRGEMLDFDQLGYRLLREVERDTFGAILIDPAYKLWPPNVEENDNNAMARVMNTLDSYAQATGTAIIFSHHFSKGNQAGKNLMDLGAGASALGRAVDFHAGLRPHEQDGCIVLEMETRSSAKPAPVGLRLDHPLWRYDPFLDTTKLKRPGKGGEDNPEAEIVWTAETFATRFVTQAGKPKDLIIVEAEAVKMSAQKAERLLNSAVATGKAYKHTFGPRDQALYSTDPQGTLAPPETAAQGARTENTKKKARKPRKAKA